MSNNKEIQFHYIKSHNFHTHHVDGIEGGYTPRGLINCNFFTERYPIPQKVVFELEDDIITKMSDVETKEGIIREIVCGIVFDLETAKEFKEWLDELIEYMEMNEK